MEAHKIKECIKQNTVKASACAVIERAAIDFKMEIPEVIKFTREGIIASHTMTEYEITERLDKKEQDNIRHIRSIKAIKQDAAHFLKSERLEDFINIFNLDLEASAIRRHVGIK